MKLRDSGQPIHAEDVASYAYTALLNRSGTNKIYTITGEETLPYKEMVSRIFHTLGKKPRFLKIPQRIFQRIEAIFRYLPGSSRLPLGILERMNMNLVFDDSQASDIFGVTPRPFQPRFLDICNPQKKSHYNLYFKRLFDIAVATTLLTLAVIPLAIIALVLRIDSPGPAIYWSERIGKHHKQFQMPKFRTMSLGTPTVATHLIENPERYITPPGHWLRKTSLDELPQLWSVSDW